KRFCPPGPADVRAGLLGSFRAFPVTSFDRLADCHLHFEGSLPVELLEVFARRAGHRFADRALFEEDRSRVRDAKGFLALYAQVCPSSPPPAITARPPRRSRHRFRPPGSLTPRSTC